MNNVRVGVIDFFGILCPGIILMINIEILLHSFETKDLPDLILMPSIDNIGIHTLIFFVLCYLLGVILRLFSPDIIDNIATQIHSAIHFYPFSKKQIKKRKIKKENPSLSKKERKKRFTKYLNQKSSKGKLPDFHLKEEKYPYYLGNKHIYKKSLTKSISVIMNNEGFHNKDNYNHWKVKISHFSNDIYNMILREEAFVRFISGSFWSILFGIFVCLISLVNCKKDNDFFETVLLSVYLFISLVILYKFKYQRRREVKVTLDAILIYKQFKK